MLSKEPHGGLSALILKRSEAEDEGPCFWANPGGKISQKDWGNPAVTLSHTVWQGALRRAVAREAQEETGILVASELLHTIEDRDLVFLRNDGSPTLVLPFWTLLVNRSHLQLGKDFTEYAWVREEELARYSFIGRVEKDIETAMLVAKTRNGTSFP